jgi:3-phenylpropionate/cinnamic acid dioxygenase small subunit
MPSPPPHNPDASKPAATLQDHLLESVVILDNAESEATGAQALAPDHSPRGAHPTAAARAAHGAGETASLQYRVEQFLFHQAELLDRQDWGRYIDLFSNEGLYWMPVTPDQTEWEDSPSIFAEDKRMMRVRMGRVTHPNAWSQAPQWGTSHIVGNVVIESVDAAILCVRSRFQVTELRRDQLRHFAGSYRHTLERSGEELRIRVQRVDLLNGLAPFDYVLQVWI